jgi:hypothetical protein
MNFSRKERKPPNEIYRGELIRVSNILRIIKCVRIFLTKKAPSFDEAFCGERGIRTPEPVTVNSFQDCRIRPLCQLSATKVEILTRSTKHILHLRLYTLKMSLIILF